MTKWEYVIFDWNMNTSMKYPIDELNHIGSVGYELVCATTDKHGNHCAFYFKRPIDETQAYYTQNPPGAASVGEVHPVANGASQPGGPEAVLGSPGPAELRGVEDGGETEGGV